MNEETYKQALIKEFEQAKKSLEELEPVPVLYKQGNGAYIISSIPKKLLKGKQKNHRKLYAYGS